MLSVKPLPGPFGAVVEGLDLSQPMDRATTKALIDAFHQNQVIVIRDQRLEFDGFDRLTKSFGTQKPHFLDHLRMRGHPAMLMLSNIFEDGKPIGVYEGAAFWHTDVAYEDPPNSATIVYALECPAGAWHCWHSRGGRLTSKDGWLLPCGWWHSVQSSEAGACSHRNGPRFSA